MRTKKVKKYLLLKVLKRQQVRFMIRNNCNYIPYFVFSKFHNLNLK